MQSVTTANEHLVVSSNMPAGELLLQNMLATSAAVAASPVLLVPKNMVAITVQMCAAEAVANYLTAGSTSRFMQPIPPLLRRTCNGHARRAMLRVPSHSTITTTVLQNVKVLAVTHALPSSGSTARRCRRWRTHWARRCLRTPSR